MILLVQVVEYSLKVRSNVFLVYWVNRGIISLGSYQFIKEICIVYCGDLMNDKIEKEERNIDVLERYLGFLGVVIALVLTIAWDFISSSKFETISKEDQIWSLVFYSVCLIALCFIGYFYIELYHGNTRSTERMGTYLLYWFVITLIVGIAPVRAYALPFLNEVFVAIGLFIGVSLGSYLVGFIFGRLEIISKLKV